MITILSGAQDTLIYNKIASAAFKTLKLKGRAYAELVFANEEEIKRVNAKTRNKNTATDVLSFPSLSGIADFTKKNYPFDYDSDLKKVFLGSIMICSSIAANQAQEYGHSIERENAYLFLHGLLHLLGYDHENEDDKRKMRGAEEQILGVLNITRN